VVLEGVVDESVERLPARPRIDGHHRSTQRDGPRHRGVGGFLDEDGRGHTRRARELPLEPAHGLGVGDAEQEEQIRRAGTDRQAKAHVVGVDQGHRPDRHVEAAGGLHQRHHRAVQGQQQLTESEAGRRCRHHALLCPIQL
jgi:hypothetical protein